MMGLISLLAGVAGFLIVYYWKEIVLPPGYAAYLSIAAMAGLDSVIGGARAAQTGKFKRRIFISGFLTAVIVAVVLTWFGSKLAVPIFLAVGFVFVYRIMQNLSIIRWYLLDDDNPHMQWFPGWKKKSPVAQEQPAALSAPPERSSTDPAPSIRV
jgi:small basic protein